MPRRVGLALSGGTQDQARRQEGGHRLPSGCQRGADAVRDRGEKCGLIWHCRDDALVLVRTGTHSDLFG